MKHTSVRILIIAIILSFAGCGNCGHVGMNLELPIKDTLRIDGELWYVEERPDSGDDGTYVLGKGKLVRDPAFSLYCNRESEMMIALQNGKITECRHFENSRKDGLELYGIYEVLNKRFPYEKYPGIGDSKTWLSFKVSDVRINEKGEILDAEVVASAKRPFDTLAVISEFKALLYDLPPVTVCKVWGEYVWEHEIVHIPMPQRLPRILWSEARSPLMLNYAYDSKPSFQGGDVNGFSKWVNVRLVDLKEQARKKGITSRMILSFVVNEEGNVENVKVLRGLSPEIDSKVARIVSSSPTWEPALDLQNEGRPVTYTFPVIFN